MSEPGSGERPETFDRRRSVDDANASKPSIWDALKKSYSEVVVDDTEAALERATNVAYADVVAVEVAEFHLLSGLRRQALDDIEAMSQRIADYYEEIDTLRARRAKGGRGVKKADIDARLDALEGLAARARMDSAKATGLVLKLTAQIASKFRHLRLVTDHTGGGGADMARKEVAVPARLSGRIREADAEITTDFLAPVKDPEADD